MHRTPERLALDAVTFDTARFGKFLVGAWVLVVVAGSVAHVAIRGRTDGVIQNLARPLLLDAELAGPAWLSSSVLLAVAVVAWMLSRTDTEQPLGGRWRLIAGTFVYLSLDEAIIIHETLENGMRSTLEITGGVPLWIFPALVAVAVIGVLCLPLFRIQPAPLRTRWIASLLLYGGGAVGFEVLNRPFDAAVSEAGMTYIVLVVAEEALEFAGAMLFLHTLVVTLASRFRGADDSSGLGSGTTVARP